MEDIARRNLDAGREKARPLGICLLICLMTGLAGCTSSSLDLFGSSKPDRSLATATVPGSAPRSTDTISDEVTVKNAVTSADVARIGGNPIPWANASTGSAGVITTVQEETGNGTHCRQFRTTRHSYMGIARFMGRTCMESNGNWQLLSFQEEN